MTEEQKVETTIVNEPPIENKLTLQDVQDQLKAKEQYKIVIETEYYKVIGQIQLLMQQIESLKEKSKK